MSDHKISILSEKFENENTGEFVEGITIMIDGKLKSMLKNTTNLNETFTLIFSPEQANPFPSHQKSYVKLNQSKQKKEKKPCYGFSHKTSKVSFMSTKSQ